MTHPHQPDSTKLVSKSVHQLYRFFHFFFSLNIGIQENTCSTGFEPLATVTLNKRCKLVNDKRMKRPSGTIGIKNTIYHTQVKRECN